MIINSIFSVFLFFLPGLYFYHRSKRLTISLRHHTHLAKNGHPYTNINYHNNPNIFIAKDDLHHHAINVTATIHNFHPTVKISQHFTAYNSHNPYCNMRILCPAHPQHRFFQICIQCTETLEVLQLDYFPPSNAPYQSLFPFHRLQINSAMQIFLT